jgi:hypothetical protein
MSFKIGTSSHTYDYVTIYIFLGPDILIMSISKTPYCKARGINLLSDTAFFRKQCYLR